jgi:hypothetical protein
MGNTIGIKKGIIEIQVKQIVLREDNSKWSA